jgi:3-hydroxyisobutyrate dehydrogenase-like beta-hydroxyacid dehydrogenase
MRVGFVGLGSMGGRMARRLAGAGHEVAGHDARPELAGALGLGVAETVSAACAAEVVFLSLPSSREVEAVVEGAGGIAEHARSGTVVVDTTTAEPSSTRRLHAVLRGRGVELVDCGISGGPGPAEHGTLTLMVGGATEAVELVRPLLDVIGSTVHQLGPTGSGHAAKAVNNFLNAVNLAAAAEAMVVGVTCGLDPAQLRDVINASSGRNWATEVRFEHILRGDYMEGALRTGLMAKDLGVFLQLAEDEGAPTFLAGPTLSVYELAIERGHRESPANRVVDVLGDLAGGVRMQRRDEG